MRNLRRSYLHSNLLVSNLLSGLIGSVVNRTPLLGRARQGSNLKPLAPEANALSIELRAQRL